MIHTTTNISEDSSFLLQGVLMHAFSRFGRRLNALCFYFVFGHIFAHTWHFFASGGPPGGGSGGLRRVTRATGNTPCAACYAARDRCRTTILCPIIYTGRSKSRSTRRSFSIYVSFLIRPSEVTSLRLGRQCLQHRALLHCWLQLLKHLLKYQVCHRADVVVNSIG